MIFLYQIETSFLVYFSLFFSKSNNNKMPGGTYIHNWTKYEDGSDRVSRNSGLRTTRKNK